MNFEEFIKTNKPEILNMELPEGHDLRFRKKINQFYYYKKAVSMLKIAALIVLLIAIPVIFLPQVIKHTAGKSNFPEDIAEAKIYYSKQIDQRIAKLSDLKIESEIEQNLFSELQVFDKTISSIQDELIKNPSNQKVHDAIILTYQKKLEFLDYVINKTTSYNL